jgi:hemolysin activation/secretion protein
MIKAGMPGWRRLGGHRYSITLAIMAWLPFSGHAQTPASPAETPQSTQTARFDIQRFQIEGNTILTASELEAQIVHLTGQQREYGDIQLAVEALEFAYRQRGYAAVQAYAPEQELTGGTVRLQVTETTIGKVTIEGEQKYFDTDNLRAGLPALIEGTTPNAQDLSAQIALVNESPAKQIEVVLGLGAEERTVDAKIKLAESNPLKLSLSLDNTGSEQTGKHRLGFALQHANLGNRDHVGTIAYQTSPEKSDKVDIYSLSYRLPIYAWAGAIDFILAKSTVDAGTTPTTAGDLAFAGSGTIFGLRYTHALPREGDTTQKVILGWDIKANDNTCDITLAAHADSGECGGSSSADVTQRPLSLTYSRMQVGPGQATEFSASLIANLAGGKNGHDADFQAARPSPVGGTGARANYGLIKGSLTHLHLFAGDWQARFVANAQWTDQALIVQEQLGLAGSNAVRGFQEREVASDTGVQISAEGYTPNLAESLNLTGNLRALAFLDAANGRNHLLDGETQIKNGLASWGLGLRYATTKDASARFDLAQVLTANGNQNRGDWRGHFSLVMSY